MSTIDENWNIVDVTRAFCQKVLPLVYDESLSYMEMVCKMSGKLNEVIENNNNLPQYVKDLIKETVNSDEFVQIVASVLMNTIINVKFPPEGITPAKGDGITDDTKSIQDCLDYANAQGGAVVFFPSGKYLTSTLSIAGKTSILGADRYNTTLFLKGGGSTPLLQGVINQSVRNIAFDGNRLNQIEENYLIDGDIENALIDNVILEDSAHCITSEKCNANEFSNVKVLDIGDSVFIDAIGNGNLLSNINTSYSIIITGDNNNWQSPQQTKIDSAEPLEYQEPQKLNDYFNYVEMKYNNINYNVLTEGNDLKLLKYSIPHNIAFHGRWMEENNLRYVTKNPKYAYSQGSFVSDDYIYVAFIDTGISSTSAQINKYDKSGNLVLSKIIENIGHCSCIAKYNDNLIVTVSEIGGVNSNTIFILNTNLNVLSTKTLPLPTEGLTGCFYYNGYLYAYAKGFLYKLDTDYNLINTVNCETSNTPSIHQTCCLYKNGFLVAGSLPNEIVYYDFNGNIIDNYLLPDIVQNRTLIYEIEGISVNNDIIYLTTCGAYGAFSPFWVTTVFTIGSANNVEVIGSNPNYSMQTYVTGEFVFSPTGSSELPFQHLEEAIALAKLTYASTTINVSTETIMCAIENGKNITINFNNNPCYNLYVHNSTNITLSKFILLDNYPNFNNNYSTIGNSSVKFSLLGVNSLNRILNCVTSEIFIYSMSNSPKVNWLNVSSCYLQQDEKKSGIVVNNTPYFNILTTADSMTSTIELFDDDLSAYKIFRADINISYVAQKTVYFYNKLQTLSVDVNNNGVITTHFMTIDLENKVITNRKYITYNTDGTISVGDSTIISLGSVYGSTSVIAQ